MCAIMHVWILGPSIENRLDRRSLQAPLAASVHPEAEGAVC